MTTIRDDTDERRLYDDLAWTWPIISPVEHYVEESEFFAKVIREHSRIPVDSLLHLGCGGGHNDYALKRHFRVTGVDLSARMLGLAGTLNPEVEYLAGDMRSVRLGRTFDAVLIVDSIAYMASEDDLKAVFATAYSHVRPGGVFVFFQEETAEGFTQNKTSHVSHREGDVEITFIENLYDPDPSDTSYEATFVYLIRREGRLEVRTDRHRCGLFTTDAVADLVEQAGFGLTRSRYDPPASALDYSSLAGYPSYPMFICHRPER